MKRKSLRDIKRWMKQNDISVIDMDWKKINNEFGYGAWVELLKWEISNDRKISN